MNNIIIITLVLNVIYSSLTVLGLWNHFNSHKSRIITVLILFLILSIISLGYYQISGII
jgi:hypothetical protein